jgi:hypothetical protein
MPLEVIGAGFGRTGTLSLKRALEELGLGPTYHMEEVIRSPSHIRRWLLYARTTTIDWDTVFADFRSGVDFPVSCVWAELAARFIGSVSRQLVRSKSSTVRYRLVFRSGPYGRGHRALQEVGNLWGARRLFKDMSLSPQSAQQVSSRHARLELSKP